jgi:hypothetical protein
MNVDERSGICKGCSYFSKFAYPKKGLDDYRSLRSYYGDNSEDDSCTYIGKCEKCNIDISLKYLNEKISCPFVKSDSGVRLVRIWCKVWNSES